MKSWPVVLAGVVLIALGVIHRAPAPRADLSVTAAQSAQPSMAPSRAPVSQIVVYVAGAVRRPGLYRLSMGARADDAVKKAGGFAPQADTAAVNLAQPLADGQEIRAIRIGEGKAPPRSRALHKKKSRKSALPANATKVNLNSAGVNELAALPGIGELLATRIVEFRKLNGPFASPDELADVSGITQRQIDNLLIYVTVR